MPSILSSWKEIALYVGRSVRTVQRWEREIGLPVHRPIAKSEGVVVALPAELDAWVRSMPVNSHLDDDGDHGMSDGNGAAARGNGGNGSAAGKSNGSAYPTNGKARAPRTVRAVPSPSV